MKRNFNRVIRDFDGQPLKNAGGKEEKMGELIARQLFAVNYGKNADEKLRAYKLCNKLVSNPENAEITTEDATMIKEVMAGTCAAGLYGQVVDLIEGE